MMNFVGLELYLPVGTIKTDEDLLRFTGTTEHQFKICASLLSVADTAAVLHMVSYGVGHKRLYEICVEVFEEVYDFIPLACFSRMINSSMAILARCIGACNPNVRFDEHLTGCPRCYLLIDTFHVPVRVNNDEHFQQKRLKFQLTTSVRGVLMSLQACSTSSVNDGENVEKNGVGFPLMDWEVVCAEGGFEGTPQMLTPAKILFETNEEEEHRRPLTKEEIHFNMWHHHAMHPIKRYIANLQKWKGIWCGLFSPELTSNIVKLAVSFESDLMVRHIDRINGRPPPVSDYITCLNHSATAFRQLHITVADEVLDGNGNSLGQDLEGKCVVDAAYRDMTSFLGSDRRTLFSFEKRDVIVSPNSPSSARKTPSSSSSLEGVGKRRRSNIRHLRNHLSPM